MHTIGNDLRLTLRQWAKAPGLCALILAVLALGLGANIAVFGFAEALLFRPANLPRASEVMRVYTSATDSRYARTSYPTYRDLARAATSFVGVAAHSDAEVSFRRGGEAESLRAEVVSGNFFDVLGLEASRGRLILPDDDAAGAGGVAVLSHRLASRRFAPGETLLGALIHVNGHPFTVIGVAPEGFQGSYDALAADLWVPLVRHEQARPRGVPIDSRGWEWLNMTARLEPGVDRRHAQEEVELIARSLAAEYPRFVPDGFSFTVVPASPLPESFRDGASSFLILVSVVAALVLLVASMNLASVLLSRSMKRRREMAIRQSLGATRGRMLQLALVESLVLAIAGGLTGIVVASSTQAGLLRISSGLDTLQPFRPTLAPDATTIAFALLLAGIVGLLLGLVPGLRSGERSVVAAVRDGGGSTGGGSSRWQSGFVGVQVAVSLVILVATGLLVRSLREAEAFDPGFRTERLLLARSALQRNGYSENEGRAYYRQLHERLSSLPGVASATFATVVPLGWDRENLGLRVEGYEPANGRSTVPVAFNVVGPRYFSTMGIPVLRGRGFDDSDRPGSPRTVVVNETMAHRFWPGQEAVGRYVELVGEESPRARIVGVVRDIKYYSLGEEPMPYLYAPFSQNYAANMVFHLRARGSEPGALAASVRREAEALDPNVALSEVMSFRAMRRVSLLPNVALAAVSSILGGLALVLSALGIYGLVSYGVHQRTREFGVRMALGAGRRRLVRDIVASGMAPVGVGIGAGLAGAAAFTRLLSSFLFGVSAIDAPSFAASAALLAGVALVAAMIPARRGATMSPVQALRQD